MPYLSIGNASKKNRLWQAPSEMFTQIIGTKRKHLAPQKKKTTLSPCEYFYWSLLGNVEVLFICTFDLCFLFLCTLFYSFFFFTATNPCLRMSCDFMCLLNPSGAKCTCPEGKVLVNGTCSNVNMSGRPAPVLMQCRVGCGTHTIMMLPCACVLLLWLFDPYGKKLYKK